MRVFGGAPAGVKSGNGELDGAAAGAGVVLPSSVSGE